MLGIERVLQENNSGFPNPPYERYSVLKHRLFTEEYSRWAAQFPGGNDHGPGHVSRVLEYLDLLLGDERDSAIGVYELFLTMMAVLYHDVGLLHGRADHGDHSGAILDLETNEYIFDRYERELIRAAVVSHSSSKDIAAECAGFSDEKIIAGKVVRPKLIAALVRLADEIDEDYRRANYTLQQRVILPTESEVYWAICQRIIGVRPNRPSREIVFNIRFEEGDDKAVFQVGSAEIPFGLVLARKLEKINNERALVKQYLPEAIRYDRLLISIRPAPGSTSWKAPRSVVLSDGMSAEDFLRAVPAGSRHLSSSGSARARVVPAHVRARQDVK